MARRKKGDPVHGWLVFDKPVGMTSTRAVAVIKSVFNARKAGHAGTLDPLASGVLPIALGEATKTVPFAMDGAKSYRFTVRWGIQTSTDDGEGETIEKSDARPDETQIKAVLDRFKGQISQVPPKFSAIRVDGQRAYARARAFEKFQLSPRKVQIDRLELVEIPDSDQAVFEVDCGKGTYVRSLARDMGRELGCLGHVVALRRTAVKPFCERDMIVLESLRELGHKGADRTELMAFLQPVEAVLDDIPGISIDQQMAISLIQGQPVILRGRDAPVNQDLVLASYRGKPVALAKIEKGMLKPKRVFNLGINLSQDRAY